MKLYVLNPGGGGGNGSGTLTGGGTIATGGFTLTVPATGTAALLGTAQTYSAARTISVAGANSTPPLYLTGALNVGGSATTTFPHIFHQPTGATAATTWSSGANAGTVFGANEATGFTGNFFDGKVAGVTTCKIIGSTGAMSVYTYNAINWAVYDSVGGTLRSYEQGGRWFATTGFCTINNALALQDDYSGVRLRNNYWIGWSADTTFYGTNDLIVGRKAAATLQLGADAASSQVSQIFSACGARIGTDTNTTPTNTLTLAGPHNTGTGTGGDLRLAVYGTNGASGTAIGTLNTVLTIVGARKVVNISSIPTSSAGLSSGDVYSNAGILTIV